MTASAIFKTLQGKDFKITFGNGNSIYSAFLQITRENKELYRVSDMIAYLDRIKCNPKEKLIPGKVYRLLLKSEEPAYLEQIAQSSEPQVQLPPKSFYLNYQHEYLSGTPSPDRSKRLDYKLKSEIRGMILDNSRLFIEIFDHIYSISKIDASFICHNIDDLFVLLDIQNEDIKNKIRSEIRCKYQDLYQYHQ